MAFAKNKQDAFNIVNMISGKNKQPTTAPTPTQTGSMGGGFNTPTSAVSKTTPTSYRGSADYVGVNDSDQQKIKDQMNTNSQAWHTADSETKAWLENENKRLSGLLGGSVSFDSGSGKWSGTAGSNTPQYPSGGMGREDFMNDYNSISAAEQAAIDAYIKQSVTGLEGQKSGVNQSAEEAARQAYISYMQSQAALPQALAANGYSGGMADSQRLALETALQSNQKDIRVNRDNALNDIDTAIQKTRLEGSIQGAQSQAQIGRDALAAWQSYMAQQNNYAHQDYWNKYGYDFQGGQAGLDREFQAGQSQIDRDWQSGESQKDRETTAQQKMRDDVMNLLLNGFMPDDGMLQSAGIDRNTAKGWFDYARGQNTRSGGTGGGYAALKDDPSKQTGITQTQYDAMADRFAAGDYSEEVIEALLTAGDSAEGLAKAGGFSRDIYSLGLGPVNEAFLVQMIQSGRVEAVNIGGSTYYRRGNANNSGGGGFPFGF